MYNHLGSININSYGEDRIHLDVDLEVKSKFNELEGMGSSFKEALEDLLEQVEGLSL